MRPKDMYTKEEYLLLKKERDSFAAAAAILNKKLEQANEIIRFLNQYDRGEDFERIKATIEEENNKQELKKLFIKHPYYIKIKEFAEMGILDLNKIAQLVDKSYSTVYRALHEMGMYPLERKSFSSSRLNI